MLICDLTCWVPSQTTSFGGNPFLCMPVNGHCEKFWLAAAIRFSEGFKCRHLRAVRFFILDVRMTYLLHIRCCYLAIWLPKISVCMWLFQWQDQYSNSKCQRFSFTFTVRGLTNTVFWPLYGWGTYCSFSKAQKKLTDRPGYRHNGKHPHASQE